jgi:hypothetical protein
MNRRVLAAIGLIGLGILLFWGGSVYGQSRWTDGIWQPGWMMGNWSDQSIGPSMMGNGMMNGGMMGMMNGGMMGNGMGMPSMHGNWSGLTNVEPLSIEEAETAVINYLDALNNDNLTLGEIMIFDNHAYAQILDQGSGQGAFEVLVDPVTRNVFPEPGPNMMWNTQYGMMAGSGNFGMMGGMMNGQYGSGMMGGFGVAPEAEINVTADEAVDIAQRYLDDFLPGKTADETANGAAVAFPGYFTIHVLEDGEVVGMLSVNVYTGQVFLHHWHGDFIEMAGEGHD